MGHEPVGIVYSLSQDIRAALFSFIQLGVTLPILHDTTYQKCSCYCAVMDCRFFLEGAVSILDLFVLVLVGNFR